MLNISLNQKVTFFLSVLASRYMKQHQGDIIIDLQGIIETLDEKGEIEIYIAENHFDTERRFQYEPYNTVEKARQNAREQHWGEYNILLKVDKEKLKFTVSIERGNNPKPFPMGQIWMVDEWESYDIIDEYGKDKKWIK